MTDLADHFHSGDPIDDLADHGTPEEYEADERFWRDWERADDAPHVISRPGKPERWPRDPQTTPDAGDDPPEEQNMSDTESELKIIGQASITIGPSYRERPIELTTISCGTRILAFDEIGFQFAVQLNGDDWDKFIGLVNGGAGDLEDES